MSFKPLSQTVTNGATAQISSSDAVFDAISTAVTPTLYDAGTFTGAIAINFANGDAQKFTINAAGPLAVTFSNPVTGGTYLLRIQQGATPGTVTWPGSVNWGTVGAPVLSNATGEVDIVSFFYDGSTYWGSAQIQDALPAANSSLTNLSFSGTAGQVLTLSGGVPAWASIPPSANTALSNLSATAINVALLGTLGAVGAPAYSFTGDTDTGMWSSAADTLNFSTNGTERMRVTNSGIQAANGAATTPSYSFASDTNTGLFRAGEDILAISTGGAQRVWVRTEGLLMLPSGGVSTKLFLVDTGGNRSARLYNDGPLNTAQLTIQLTDNTNADFIAGRWKESGHLGVGTGDPVVRLHVQQTSATTNAVTNVLRVDSQSSGTPATGIGVGIEMAAETAAGNTEVGVVLEAVTTDVTATSEDFDFVVKNMAAGAAATERLRVTSTGDTKVTGGNLSVETVGKGLKIKTGSNATAGKETGISSVSTVTINTTAVTANSLIFVQPMNSANTHGFTVDNIVAGTSFDVDFSGNYTGDLAWFIIEPA